MRFVMREISNYNNVTALPKMTILLQCLCLALVELVVLVDCEPYSCEDNYVSTNHIGSLRVPTNCSAANPSYCPRSWKSGIPAGLATSKPLIYLEFIICHEGFSSCGYVPLNPKNGEVLGHSGVTIGAGVDLGSKSANYPGFSALPSSLVDKLKPYFGLQKNLSACAAIEQPLELSTNEATNLTNASVEHMVKRVEERYNKDKAESLLFLYLPRGIRTVIVSVWFQFGEPEAYPRFWSFVRENNWEEAIKELRNFYGNPDKQQRGDLKRRNNEADIMEAALLKCNRTLDAVFLVHESGKISSDDFDKGLDFVRKVITAFPDEKLQGNNNTRFALSTFASLHYTNFFPLSKYTSQHDYMKGIDEIRKLQAGAGLGFALEKLLPDQFAQQYRVRSEEHGTPLVLIILSFEPAQDMIRIPAQHVRDKNIVVYSIGVENYDVAQLREVATSRSHIYTPASVSGLKTFAGTLTASLCNEPQPVYLNKRISAMTTNKQYQYYLCNANDATMNLKIHVIDLEGETRVYVSRGNPHPYKYDNDVSFETFVTQKNKILVITPEALDVSRNATGYQDMATIFVSVLANTETASYTIEGSACSPLKCREGTNEGVSTAGLSYKKSDNFQLFLAAILLLLNFSFLTFQ